MGWLHDHAGLRARLVAADAEIDRLRRQLDLAQIEHDDSVYVRHADVADEQADQARVSSALASLREALARLRR